MTDSQPIRGAIRWSEGIDTEIVYSRTLEDGTERHIDSIEIDGVRWTTNRDRDIPRARRAVLRQLRCGDGQYQCDDS